MGGRMNVGWVRGWQRHATGKQGARCERLGTDSRVALSNIVRVAELPSCDRAASSARARASIRRRCRGSRPRGGRSRWPSEGLARPLQSRRFQATRPAAERRPAACFFMPIPPTSASASRLIRLLAIVSLLLGCGFSGAQSPSSAVRPAGSDSVLIEGPVRLQQLPAPTTAPGTAGESASLLRQPGRFPSELMLRPTPQPRELDEFERFASRLAGPRPDGEPTEIRRFGSEVLRRELDPADDLQPLPMVPPDYAVQPGDELRLALWGSVDADLELRVDRAGLITVPRVGSIPVAGARYSELDALVRRRVERVFRNFDLAVSLGRLRPVRVFVTGFVESPGAYTLGSLSTISHAVMRAGGPASSGSFRKITLRRAGQPPRSFDIYELLVRGERGGDLRLQPDDVVHVGPVGTQVALIGSVNRPAIFELLPGETVRDLIEMGGGLSAVADVRRLTLERLQDRDTVRVTEWPLPESESRVLSQGDVLRAISVVAVAGSQLPQNKRVRVEGEVRHPGTYVLPPGSTLQDAVAAAGGLTESAFLFGTEFTRESVRLGQQENYDRALRDVETEFARAAALQRASSPEEATSQSLRAASTTRLIDRLRALRPTGRVVLELTPESANLPALLLEDGDRIMVPPRATSVGVFGSVFSTGNYLFGEQRQLADYLRLAGGPTRAADRRSVFVIRANGTVISESQSSGWFAAGTLGDQPALPGDTIFVPEEIDRTTFLQSAKDWTQVLYQFGLGVAAFKSLSN
ncbi:MAG: SLBB domain-containing protein [Burkholderiales bacterium]|nr:SLBB domain-containing protein [Burkholderiales bacterium]